MTSKTVIFDYQTYIKDENLEKIKRILEKK